MFLMKGKNIIHKSPILKLYDNVFFIIFQKNDVCRTTKND